MNLLRGPHRKPAKVIVEKNSPFVNALDSLVTKPQVVSPEAAELLETLEPHHISPALTGDTGHSNLELATTLARELGASIKGCRIAAEKFQGLPHRFEFVPGKDDLIYINDSKATTPDATISALSRLTVSSTGFAGAKTRESTSLRWFHTANQQTFLSIPMVNPQENWLTILRRHPIETLEQAFHDARNCAAERLSSVAPPIPRMTSSPLLKNGVKHSANWSFRDASPLNQRHFSGRM